MNLVVIITLALLSTITVVLTALPLRKTIDRNQQETTKYTCLQYEQAGVIEKGSCACVEKLYKTWEESYDWKDACIILHSTP